MSRGDKMHDRLKNLKDFCDNMNIADFMLRLGDLPGQVEDSLCERMKLLMSDLLLTNNGNQSKELKVAVGQ